jgi:hypothetical protein
VEPEIKPEPTPEERAAILAALRELAGERRPATEISAWRRLGVRENLDADDED